MKNLISFIGLALFVASIFLPDLFASDGVTLALICGAITSNIEVDCDNPLVQGTDERLIVINKSDIDSVLLNGSNPLIVEDIVLLSGKTAFVLDGKNHSLSGSFLKKANDTYEHTAIAKAFANAPLDKKQLELYGKGKFVLILENNHKGAAGNSAFEVYGLSAGLKLLTHTRNTDDSATDGAHALEFKTSEKSSEPHVPSTFFLTDYATTKVLVDGLL